MTTMYLVQFVFKLERQLNEFKVFKVCGSMHLQSLE